MIKQSVLLEIQSADHRPSPSIGAAASPTCS